MGHLFDTDTQVTRVGDGTYAAEITDRWHAMTLAPNGGYLLAVCLEALRQDMPFPDALTVSAYYLRRATVGAAQVRTEVVRAGRRLATGEASLLQEGREVIRVVASYTDLDQARGRTVLLGEAPELPGPEECIDPLDGLSMPGATLLDQVEYRVTELPGWLKGAPGGDPSLVFWTRFKDGREPDLASLAFFTDSMAPAVLDLGEPPSTTLELTVHLRGRPAPGWLACRVATRYVTGGFHEEDMEIWDSAGRLVAQSRQLALIPAPPPG